MNRLVILRTRPVLLGSVACAIAIGVVVAFIFNGHSLNARSQTSSSAPVVAGLTSAQWLQQQGLVIGAPASAAAVTAQAAEQVATAKFPGCTPLNATLVQMSMPGSQVVPNATYWALQMTPSAAMAAGPGGGPAGASSAPPPATNMVVFINAQTGAYVIAQLWS